MRASILALLLALPAGAQDAPRVVIQVRDGQVRTLGGETVQVSGGAYLDGPSLMAAGKEVAALRAENAALKEGPSSPPMGLVVALLAGVAIGLAGGIVVAQAVR